MKQTIKNEQPIINRWQKLLTMDIGQAVAIEPKDELTARNVVCRYNNDVRHGGRRFAVRIGVIDDKGLFTKTARKDGGSVYLWRIG